VTVRYRRVVGEMPPDAPLPEALLREGLPGTADQAVSQALQNNAALRASAVNVRVAKAVLGTREAALQPTVEARLRAGGGHNVDWTLGRSSVTTAEVVLNWPLFDGGANQARVRQQARLLTEAEELRDKVCLDVTQTMTIAYNDTRKLTEQIDLLERNLRAIEKARDAYLQQFEISQRSLLDLLNAENELYLARRSYINARFDLATAYARAQAAMNRLGPALGSNAGALEPPSTDETTEDGVAACGRAAG
jgi:adhesin transport system outer membrane protein